MMIRLASSPELAKLVEDFFEQLISLLVLERHDDPLELGPLACEQPPLRGWKNVAALEAHPARALDPVVAVVAPMDARSRHAGVRNCRRKHLACGENSETSQAREGDDPRCHSDVLRPHLRTARGHTSSA